MDPDRALYVHVPFCLHRCGYCDFTLVADRDHLIPEYLRLLSAEIEFDAGASSHQRPVTSVFIGGGTPTHLSPTQLESLFELIFRHFRVSPAAGSEFEFTVEANPDGLCPDRLKVLQRYGVNRLSLGVQSFDDDVLHTLERRHTAADARESVVRAARLIPNISVDLIFGVPGQTPASWRDTLKQACELPVQHASAYGLTYEQGTPFYRRERSGQLSRTSDEIEARMFRDAERIFGEHGFVHYEISNYARPGSECRHNMVYWNAKEYYAFGPGAARYIDGVRSTNCRSLVRWMRAWSCGTPCHDEVEELNAEDKAREAVMLALRQLRGLHLATFEERFMITVAELAEEALERHLNAGLLQIQDGWLRLTEPGLLIADSVVSDFL